MKTPLHFFLIINLILYIPGLFMIWIYFPNLVGEAFQLVSILLISIIFTFVGWFSTRTTTIVASFSVNKFAVFMLFIYIAAASYVFYQTPPALFFLDDPNIISEYRELSTKGKIGYDSIINGLYYASSYIALPLITLKYFNNKSNFRYIIVILITLSLMLTLEKARAYIIFIPLFFFVLKKNGYLKSIFAPFLFLLIIYAAALAAGIGAANSSNNYSNDFEERAIISKSKMLFSEPNTTEYLINRVIWIPYITAIDWIRYNNIELKNKLLLGQSIPLVATIIGHSERFKLENDVYKFQFDEGDDSLGSANSHFALDAFINYGYVGIMIYAFIFGSIIKYVWTSLPSPYNLIAYNYAFAVTFGNLHALFLGGGLLIIIVFIILDKIFKKKERHDGL